MYSKNRMQLTGKCAVCGLISVATLLVTGGISQAKTKCYTFDGPAVGSTYHVGDTVNARHSDVYFRTLKTENGPPQNPGEASIVQSNLPQGQPPALKIARLSTQIIPKKPVKSVTLQYAENIGANDNQVWSFGANGDVRSWTGQLSAINGEVLGQGPSKAKVTVTAEPQPDSNWIIGTLELAAKQGPLPGAGGIRTLSFGRTSQLMIDSICITE